MPGRRSVSVPSYRLHKQSGQAVVTLSDPLTGRRKDVLLGAYGTPESRAEYVRVLGEWETAGRRVLERQAGPDLTINELALAFWPHIEAHYKNPDGSPTKEVGEFKLAIRVLREAYGFTIAAEFGPMKLNPDYSRELTKTASAVV